MTEPDTPMECQTPPAGWRCSREAGHDGPCAARPTGTPMERATEAARPIYKRLIPLTNNHVGAVSDTSHEMIRAAVSALLSDEEAMVEVVAEAMGACRVEVNAAVGYTFPPGEATRRARADALVAVQALVSHLLGEAPA